MVKLLIVGVWAVAVTVGAGYAGAALRMQPPEEDGPRFEGLRYTSVPTLSVPVVEDGAVSGYIVLRMVYTTDAAVLRNLASPPDSFISDEAFRTLYGAAETRFGKLRRIDIDEFTQSIKTRVNERMGDAVIQDLLVDGLNYVNLADPQSVAAAGRMNAPFDGPRGTTGAADEIGSAARN